MPTRSTVLATAFALAALILPACGAPQPMPTGPTPIPTLIPATMPPGRIAPTEAAPPVVESYPVGVPAADAGRDLYVEHCAECHGPDGKGLVPNARDFGDVDYMRGETPVSFYVAITEGVGEEMPAFGQLLSSDERWDLTYFVWRYSTSDAALTVGQEIYGSICVACHGPDGRSMILGAADLSDQRFISHQAPSQLYLSVTQGRGSMPAWQARLTQSERWAVIDYLRTFSYSPQLSGEVLVAEGAAGANEAELPPCDPAYLILTNPFGWDNAQAIAAGEPIYVRECAECHAEDGTGAIPEVRDLTNPAVRADLLTNVGERFCRVAEGLNRMPAYKETLSQDEIWQALTYMASFGD